MSAKAKTFKTIEEAILDVVTRKGLISFHRLADILYHNYSHRFKYGKVLSACDRLLAEKPPRLRKEKVPSWSLSLSDRLIHLIRRPTPSEEEEKEFWFYYVDRKEFERRKRYVFNITKKWVYKLARNKGDFFRDLVARAIQKILKDKKYSGWNYKGKEVRRFDNVDLGRKIDVLLELPDKSLLWIECKNQTKLVTRKTEISKYVKDLNHVQTKLPHRIFRRAIVCPFMSRQDQSGCLQGTIIYPVTLEKLYFPNNKYKKDYDECIKEFELDSIVEQINVNFDPPEIEDALRNTIFAVLINLPRPTIPWDYGLKPKKARKTKKPTKRRKQPKQKVKATKTPP